MAEPARPPRRVAFVIDKLAERSGGAERVLIETANALAARGHLVEILTHEPRGRPPFYPLAFGVSHSNLRRPQAARGRLRRALDALARDAARPRRPLPAAGRPADVASKHGGFWRRLERHLGAAPPRRRHRLPAAGDHRARARPPGRAAAPGGVAAQRARARPRQPRALGPQPARPGAAHGGARRTSTRSPCSCPSSATGSPSRCGRGSRSCRTRCADLGTPASGATPRGRTVLSIGRLAPVKRQGLLIEAWARLAGEFPDWTLKIFGIGPLEAELAAGDPRPRARRRGAADGPYRRHRGGIPRRRDARPPGRARGLGARGHRGDGRRACRRSPSPTARGSTS